MSFTYYSLVFVLMLNATLVSSTAVVKTQKPHVSVANALKLITQRVREDTESGVITNQVMTVAGQDFYHYFVTAWRDKDGSEQFTLAVRERPSARWGSEVWIEYGQRKVFSSRLPIARAGIRQMSEDAAEQSYRGVLRIVEQRKMNQDADVGADEF